MSYCGLASGYVRFETTAHKILLLLHEHGQLMHSDFLEEEVGTAANIGMALTKLRRYSFIFPVGKVSKYEAGTEKTQMLYSLKKRDAGKRQYVPASQKERDAGRKKSKRQRQLPYSWVFGPITSTPQVSDR